MAIECRTESILLSGVITAEEAQSLHEALLGQPDARIDLFEVTHLHTAVIQILLAARPAITRTFKDEYLRNFIAPYLNDRAADRPSPEPNVDQEIK